MHRLNIDLDTVKRCYYGELIVSLIEQTPQFADAKVVALFSSLHDEIPTATAIDRWAKTKKIVLPRVEGETMQFYEYDATKELHTGSYSILEPQPLRLATPETIDLMVVPGVAFTPQGDRLGRGAGYYDKYLSQPHFRGYTIGICYPHQLIETIPCEEHDVRLNQVIAAE